MASLYRVSMEGKNCSLNKIKTIVNYLSWYIYINERVIVREKERARRYWERKQIYK